MQIVTLCTFEHRSWCLLPHHSWYCLEWAYLFVAQCYFAANVHLNFVVFRLGCRFSVDPESLNPSQIAVLISSGPTFFMTKKNLPLLNRYNVTTNRISLACYYAIPMGYLLFLFLQNQSMRSIKQSKLLYRLKELWQVAMFTFHFATCSYQVNLIWNYLQASLPIGLIKYC